MINISFLADTSHFFCLKEAVSLPHGNYLHNVSSELLIGFVFSVHIYLGKQKWTI
jgi:hypothetical protein